MGYHSVWLPELRHAQNECGAIVMTKSNFFSQSVSDHSQRRPIRKHERGFTLIEIMIGLVIISLIIAGALGLLKVQYQQAKLDDTLSHQEQIEQAIFAHLRTNGTLPCPAPLGISSDDPAYGRSVDCSVPAPNGTIRVDGRDGLPVRIGAFPARDFELADSVMEDSWGQLFTYAVTESLTLPNTMLPGDPDVVFEVMDSSAPVDFRYANPEITPENFSVTAPNAVIQSGEHLYLVTNTASASDTDDRYFMVQNYFLDTDQPDIWIRDPDAPAVPVVIAPAAVLTNVINIENRIYDSAAIEIHTPDGDSLSPPNPNTGAVSPGHNSFIVISHGSQGDGGFNAAGVQVGSCDSGVIENENCDADATFVASAEGFSLAANDDYYDDMVIYSASLSGVDWPPHRPCEADGNTSNGDDGFQILNPDGTWGECLDLRGPKGPKGDKGATGDPGTSVTGIGCADGMALQKIQDDGTAVCIAAGGGGGGGTPANLSCPPGRVLTGFDAAGALICNASFTKVDYVKFEPTETTGTYTVTFSFPPDVVVMNAFRATGSEADSSWIIEKNEAVDAIMSDWGSQSMRITAPRLQGNTLTFSYTSYGAGLVRFRLMAYSGVQ
jgi:prepilin-type N-terminal cleavage/methylation domain-containing protein